MHSGHYREHKCKKKQKGDANLQLLRSKDSCRRTSAPISAEGLTPTVPPLVSALQPLELRPQVKDSEDTPCSSALLLPLACRVGTSLSSQCFPHSDSLHTLMGWK